jgi:hypothetical protein
MWCHIRIIFSPNKTDELLLSHNTAFSAKIRKRVVCTCCTKDQKMNADSLYESVVVTIDDLHSSQIQVVAKQLEKTGLVVNSILPMVGIITGKTLKSEIGKIRNTPGVRDVEVDTQMNALD